ncbi:MAG: PAS domain S-box protein [Rhodocyclales bacterium]|nr:PAS domain S-box protein [Rhodocyclales bacterium]
MTFLPIRNLAGKWLVAAFFLLAAGIGALWYSALSAYEAAVQRERGRELQAIAELKIEFVRFWLSERRGDLAIPASAPLIARAAEFGIESAGMDGADVVLGRLEAFRNAHGYESVMLLDRAGRFRAEIGSQDEITRERALESAHAAMGGGKTLVSRVYASQAGGAFPLYIDIATPVIAAGKPSPRIVGALVFRIDPQAHLGLLLGKWPSPSEGGETFLVERMNDQIVYLSSLRHAEAAALQRKTDDPSLPAALAARGQQGVTEGLDYRGVPVLAAVGQVPGMPWFVVAKLDRDEILAPVRREALWSGTLAALLVLALGLAMFSWWRRSRSELALAQQASAKEALTASEARFRKLHEHGWDFNALFDRNMVIRYASPSIDRYLGRKAAGEDIGVGTARVHPDDVARVEAARQAALNQPGKPQCVEHRLARGDGAWLTVESCFTNHFDDPDIEALSYVARDITERKQSEIALRSQQQLNQHYLDTVQTVIVALDALGRITMINRKGSELLGYTEEELRGRFWFDTCLPQPEGLETVYPVFLRLMAGDLKTEEYFENAILCRNGQQRTIAWHNAILTDATGNPVGTLSSGEDITLRKQAEKELLESDERYRYLFRLSPDAVFVHRDNVILFANDATARLFHAASPQDLVGRDWHELIAPEDWTKIEARVASLNSGEMAFLPPAELVYRTLDGMTIHAEATAARIVIEGIPVILSVARDITERRQAETQRLEQARRQRDALVREVHHRIKNHLQGLAGLLRQHMGQHAPLKPALEEVVGQISAISIVHGLQGRNESGQISLRGLVVEIAAFLSGVMGVPLRLAEREGQCFMSQPCSREEVCKWAVAEEESVPLALILNELLTNAVRHRLGDAPPSLDIECDGEGARLTIRNPGRLPAGLDFAQGKELGTGLGLVRSLLPTRGATIGLAGAEDGWVETTVLLAAPPLVRAAAAGSQVASLR